MIYTIPNRSTLILHLLVTVILVTLIVQLSSARRYDDYDNDVQNRLDYQRGHVRSELERLRRSGKDFKSFYKKHFGKQWERFYKVMLSILKLSSNTCLHTNAVRWGPNMRSTENVDQELQEQLEEKFLELFVKYVEDKCKNSPGQQMEPGQPNDTEPPPQDQPEPEPTDDSGQPPAY